MEGRRRPVFNARALIVADSLSAALNKVTFSRMYLRVCTASTTATASPVVTKSEAGIVRLRPRHEDRTHLGLFRFVTIRCAERRERRGAPACHLLPYRCQLRRQARRGGERGLNIAHNQTHVHAHERRVFTCRGRHAEN